MRRRKTAIFFLILGICLIVLAIALNVGWILLNLREVALLVLGMVFFALIITGLVLNTIFLVREIRRSEQHDAFLNAVTHELKTPLASIRLYLDTLRSRDLSPEKREEFYGVMKADSDRLLATVEQVLDASRLREKRGSPERVPLDVSDLLHKAADIVIAQRKLADGAIRFAEPSEPLTVVGNGEELQTAFLNLLDNAVKYSEHDPRISIRLKRSSVGDRADIFIKDSGIGIPQRELRRIFKRFYRGEKRPAGSARGTGLGLFIVRSIIEKHGGRVRAQSRGPGHGSTFLVRLPIA